MVKQFNFDDVPFVKTTAGLVKGYQFEETYIFKGIRYATAKRFQAPQPVEAWEGVKDATSYGFVCPMLTKDNPTGELMIPHRYWPQDEDCLSLNIWSQNLDENAKKPVMFWIHGGGFSMGSSIEQKAYNGENMSKFGDCVVVSINHRLNILGYLDLSAFGEKYANSANAGQADIVAALRWVRDNISAFGGDPENVTIFGQSGGGMKVSALMQTPEADGLFHRAIIMSGVMGNNFPSAPTDSRPLIMALLKELNLNADEVEKLETVPYHDLAEAYLRVTGPMGAMAQFPMPNEFYLGEGPAVGFTEHAKTIPVMVGTCMGEFAMMPLPFDKHTIPAEALHGILQQRFGEDTDRLIELYQKAFPDKCLADILNYDNIFRTPSKEFIHSFAEQGGKVYPYVFTLEFPVQQGKIAWHCSDIAFVFHNTDLVPSANIPEVSDKVETQIFDAVMRFARTGDPNGEGLPTWPATTAEDEATMIFDKESEVRHNFDNELQALYPKFDMMALLASMGDVQH